MTTSITIPRERIVETARSYIGTPFHDGAQLKGIGIDCANLLAAVFKEAGAIDDIPIEPYPPQIFIHSAEEAFLAYLERYLHRVDENSVGPGDVVIWKMGRSYGHAAFILDWPQIIHAWKPARAVIRDSALISDLNQRPRLFYSAW